jgi:hypothetical protein
MSQPRYQEVPTDTIPLVETDGVSVRVVAGAYGDEVGPVTEIAAQPLYMDVTLEPYASFKLPVSEGHSAFAYVIEGGGSFAEGTFVEAVKMVVFEDGDSVHIEAGSDSHVRFILVAGAPFNEPIVPYGPFVMNTEEEIRQALADLRNGTFVQER